MSKHKIDLTNEPSPRARSVEPEAKARKFVGMQFECCRRYARIYLNREGTAYQGNCPKCGKAVKLRVGPGGTDARFFRVS